MTHIIYIIWQGQQNADNNNNAAKDVDKARDAANNRGAGPTEAGCATQHFPPDSPQQGIILSKHHKQLQNTAASQHVLPRQLFPAGDAHVDNDFRAAEDNVEAPDCSVQAVSPIW